jgi:hypothetical protein
MDLFERLIKALNLDDYRERQRGIFGFLHYYLESKMAKVKCLMEMKKEYGGDTLEEGKIYDRLKEAMLRLEEHCGKTVHLLMKLEEQEGEDIFFDEDSSSHDDDNQDMNVEVNSEKQ